MMRRWVLPLLLLLNLGLLAWLAWQWFTPQGQWKGVHWQPPAPLKPALDGGVALPETGIELGRYVATLERPLFAPSRRPPPPPLAASAPPVVIDTPPDLRVLGLYGARGEGAGSGGMIARIDGQVRRVRVGGSVGRWTLKELRPGEAVLSLNGTEQTYPLRRAGPDEPPVSASADNAGSGAAASPARPTAAQASMQKEIELARERVRRMNVLRARSGLPPLPEP
jgi:hypothetical protein